MADVFLTVEEVAELLRLNQQTVRNMIDRGELRAVRIGQRRVRIRQSDLDAFIAAGDVSPGGSAAAEAPSADRQLRGELVDCLARAQAGLRAGDDVELVRALRSVSRAATRLARVLELGQTGPTRRDAPAQPAGE